MPCEEIPAWQDVAQQNVPQSVEDRLGSEDAFFITDQARQSFIQTLENASGAVVNMDYYGVRVPKDALPGGRTPEQYLNHVRTHINDFVDTDFSRFDFYPGLDGEQARWESSHPLGTAFSIQLMAGGVSWLDDGTVITTGYTSKSWTFSTVYSGADYAHPVSGNRRFGFTDNGDGTVTLYTRGVDRISRIDYKAVNTLSKMRKKYSSKGGIVFYNADQLWESLQNKIKSDVGAEAVVLDPVTYRPDYDRVEDVISNGADPSILEGC